MLVQELPHNGTLEDFDHLVDQLTGIGIRLQVRGLEDQAPYRYEATFYDLEGTTGNRFKWSTLTQAFNYALLYLNKDGSPR